MMGDKGRGSGGFRYVEMVWMIWENLSKRKVKTAEKNNGTIEMNNGAIEMVMVMWWYDIEVKI